MTLGTRLRNALLMLLVETNHERQATLVGDIIDIADDIDTLEGKTKSPVAIGTISVRNPNSESTFVYTPSQAEIDLANASGSNKIPVVKEIRARLGWGLAEAKNAMDALYEKLGK